MHPFYVAHNSVMNGKFINLLSHQSDKVRISDLLEKGGCASLIYLTER